jgi:hypothetical protein
VGDLSTHLLVEEGSLLTKLGRGSREDMFEEILGVGLDVGHEPDPHRGSHSPCRIGESCLLLWAEQATSFEICLATP